jgi:hypothetical protein
MELGPSRREALAMAQISAFGPLLMRLNLIHIVKYRFSKIKLNTSSIRIPDYETPK